MCSFCVNPAKKSLRKLVGRVFKSVLVLSTVAIWGKLVFLKICFFLLSGKLSENFVPFGKRNWAKLSKIHFTCPENLLACYKNLKTHKCLVFSYFERKKNWENFSAYLLKLYSSCPQQQFGEKVFFENFFSFWGFENFFLPYGKRNSVILLKRRFTSPEDQFSR